MAAMFVAMSGSAERALMRCMCRASSSLPVPVSPRMSTMASVPATCSAWRTTFNSASLLPTMGVLGLREGT